LGLRITSRTETGLSDVREESDRFSGTIDLDSGSGFSQSLHYIPYLKGAENYAAESNRMNVIPIHEDLWDVVDPKREDKTDATGKLNNEVLVTLVLPMTHHTACQVRDQTTA
jgi:hypothetical protein